MEQLIVFKFECNQSYFRRSTKGDELILGELKPGTKVFFEIGDTLFWFKIWAEPEKIIKDQQHIILELVDRQGFTVKQLFNKLLHDKNWKRARDPD